MVYVFITIAVIFFGDMTTYLYQCVVNDESGSYSGFARRAFWGLAGKPGKRIGLVIGSVIRLVEYVFLCLVMLRLMTMLPPLYIRFDVWGERLGTLLGW